MGNSYQTVAFQTLGCKLNYAETSTIERSFIKSGYSIVDFDDPADVYVINSCSVKSNPVHLNVLLDASKRWNINSWINTVM